MMLTRTKHRMRNEKKMENQKKKKKKRSIKKMTKSSIVLDVSNLICSEKNYKEMKKQFLHSSISILNQRQEKNSTRYLYYIMF